MVLYVKERILVLTAVDVYIDMIVVNTSKKGSCPSLATRQLPGLIN